MSTAFPQNGGYSLWVQAAFGDFWGLQESYWSWFSGVVDSALYPVLLYSSAAQLLAYDIVPSADQPLSSNHSHHVCPKDSSDDSDTVNLWVCIGASPSCAPEYLAKLAILLVFTSPNLVSVSLVSRAFFPQHQTHLADPVTTLLSCSPEAVIIFARWAGC